MTNNSKPMCVLCHVQLNKLENDEYLWICPEDKSHKYQIYVEVISYDNKFSSIYSEEEEKQLELAGLEGKGNPIILTASDNTDTSSILDKERKNTDIPIPKYMQNSETTKVTYYREE